MKKAVSGAVAVSTLAMLMLWKMPGLSASAPTLVLVSGSGRTVPLEAEQVFTVVDFPATPPTLPELLKAVDLVVLARVDAISKAQADRGVESPKVRRIQDLTILEILKGENRGPRIKVRQSGGTVSVSGKDYSTDYPVRLFEVGDTVVLFLLRVPTPGAVYDIAYGADGAIWSKGADQRVSLPPGLSKMPEFAGRAPERVSDLLATIRASRTGKQEGQL